MKKYIDAEKLLAEVERLKQLNMVREDEDYAQYELDVACGYDMAYEDIVSTIDSLQQEQPEVDLGKEIDECWENWVFPPTNEYAVFNKEEFINMARHFYELGRCTKYQQIRAEFVKLKANEWQDGSDEGYAKGLNAIKEENVSVAESPSKTFPRVNEFDSGSSYRH